MKDHLKKIEELSFVEDNKNLFTIIDEFPEIFWLTEKNRIIYINKMWYEFTGLPFNKEYSRSWIKGVHPDDLSRCEKIIPRGYKPEPAYEIEYRLRYHAGGYRWILEKGKPIFSKDGTFKGFIGVCIDIDNQKKTELELLTNKEKYHRLFETARDGILILDSDTGEIIDVNPFLVQLLGYSKKEFLGKKLWEVGSFKNIKTSKDTFKLLQETGYVRYDDLPLETIDGKLVDVEFISNSYMTAGVRVMQCNIRDISNRKRMEAADKAMILLEQEKLKNTFIADATHELRTPLAIIKGNVELALRDKEENSFPLETFRAINIEINNLVELLSDLTILTRENNDDFDKKISTHNIKLSELILRVAEKYKKIAIPKDITVNIKVVSGLVVLGDKAYLEKLFSNIISNAVFYGKKKGKVSIEAKKRKNHAIITVTDNGIGVPKDDIVHIFKRFYRADNARMSNHEGTGLGLAISKWITEAHKGTIEASSVYRKGTTFTITLPVLN